MQDMSFGCSSPPAVLIVDASGSSRTLMRTMLCELLLTIEEASDGASAFERLISRRFDLLITNLDMVPVDGGKLILAAGLLDAVRRPRILICSAQHHIVDAAQGLAVRMADRTLSKPLNASGFVTAVRELLNSGYGCAPQDGRRTA